MVEHMVKLKTIFSANKLLRISILEFLDDIQKILHLMWWVPQQPPSPLTTTTLRNADMFEIYPTEAALAAK